MWFWRVAAPLVVDDFTFAMQFFSDNMRLFHVLLVEVSSSALLSTVFRKAALSPAWFSIASVVRGQGRDARGR